MAGSRFVRADLHVHSVLGPGDPVGPGPAPTVATVVQAARSAGIQILAITDHNTAVNAREAATQTTGGDLLVLPGIEISTADGHLLGIFDPAAVDELESFSRPENLRLQSVDAAGAQRSRRSMAELIDEVGARGGIAIAAHIDSTDGLLSRANSASLADILTAPSLAGLEITKPESVTIFTRDDSNVVRKSLWTSRLKSLGSGPAALARTMSSDAHTPAKVGIDAANRVLTRLKVDDLSFAAVRSALMLYPNARCKLEASLEAQYPRLVSARFEGGFVDGLSIEFSPNLNCLIGGRGSGKSTILESVRALMLGFDDVDHDEQANHPEYTEVVFIDELGTTRRAGRRRHGQTVDLDRPGSTLSFAMEELEQNFGAEFIDEDQSTCPATRAFLLRFFHDEPHVIEEERLQTELQGNATRIKETSVATENLKTLRSQKRALDGKLAAATNANLAKVAQLARSLLAESPLLAELNSQLSALPEAALPATPDLGALAARFGVDLANESAAKFVDGPTGLAKLLEALESNLAAEQDKVQVQVSAWTKPAADQLAKWQAEHVRMEKSIEALRQDLKKAGLTLQVEELDRIRLQLKSTNEAIQKNEEFERQYEAAVKARAVLLTSLRASRDRRRVYREAKCKSLVEAMNARGGARVSIKWKARADRVTYAERLGQLLELRSPRKERLAEVITPEDLATLIWDEDLSKLSSIGAPNEAFFPDPEGAMSALRTYDTIFELDCMYLDDVPTVSVRFAGEPAGPGLPLRERSLGQIRSVLLGFLLASPGNDPMILDQPEDHLDGPFIAETLVGYLHGVKERRQLILATHNPNVVVLGDAELVIPLTPAKGVATADAMGSVDNSATVRRIVRLLEGGGAAFKARADRYDASRAL
jgi:energy-coupling factor transporter ATP-binding protein EcfA2